MAGLTLKQQRFADEYIIKPNFPPTVFRLLDKHQIPVDGRLVAVKSRFVGVAGCEMEAAADFLVEESVLHGGVDVRIDTEGELADIAGAFIGVKDVVEFLCLICCGFDNFSVLEFEPDIVVGDALVDGRCVIGDDAIDRFPYGSRIHFAIRDVAES